MSLTRASPFVPVATAIEPPTHRGGGGAAEPRAASLTTGGTTQRAQTCPDMSPPVGFTVSS